MVALLALMTADMARPTDAGAFYDQGGQEVSLALAIGSTVDAEGLYQVTQMTLLPNIVELDAGNPVSAVSYTNSQSFDVRMAYSQDDGSAKWIAAYLSNTIPLDFDRANTARRYDVLLTPTLVRA